MNLRVTTEKTCPTTSFRACTLLLSPLLLFGTATHPGYLGKCLEISEQVLLRPYYNFENTTNEVWFYKIKIKSVFKLPQAH